VLEICADVAKGKHTHISLARKRSKLQPSSGQANLKTPASCQNMQRSQHSRGAGCITREISGVDTNPTCFQNKGWRSRQIKSDFIVLKGIQHMIEVFYQIMMLESQTNTTAQL
jgi:hypothetical protein